MKSWRQVCSWALDGTYLEVVPNAAGGFFIVDSRKPDRSIASALRIEQAKRAAERFAESGRYDR